MSRLGDTFLNSARSRVKYYKELGDKSLSQLTENEYYFKPNETSNSIAVIIQHMAGNMLSRWTSFLTEDGEKEWRNRDREFEERQVPIAELMAFWEEGWNCFLTALGQLNEDDLLKTVHIRTEPILVIDAINRQLTHYPYHIGQIVYLARLIKNKDWKNLSIPPGRSVLFNEEMKKSQPQKLK